MSSIPSHILLRFQQHLEQEVRWEEVPSSLMILLTKKEYFFSPELMAKKVFVDPELSIELPAFTTAATGMDALTHNIEAYLAKGFSPLCDGIALEGIRLVAKSLKGAVHSPNVENRAETAMAALMGATAFQKGLGVVHSLPTH